MITSSSSDFYIEDCIFIENESKLLAGVIFLGYN